MTIKTNILFIFTVCLFYSFSSGNKDDDRSNDGITHKDTAQAVVAYGEEYLFESAKNLSALDFSNLIDSLLHDQNASEEVKREIAFYKSTQNKSNNAIYEMIDSLFELDSVPYRLVNQLHLYLALHPEDILLPANYSFVNNDTSFYPAQVLYNRWNSRAAFDYPTSLAENDSTVVLLLKQNIEDYHHPIGEKTLRRYFGWVTSPFGWRDGRSHNGVDLELHYWDSIYCMFPGKVRMARTYSDFGRVVIVRHYNGLETLYAHMSKIKVKEGQEVKAGDMLGHGGQTGNATGVHLHLEVRFKGVPLNPSHIISFKNKDVISDTIAIKKMRRTYIAYPVGTEYHVVKRGEYPNKVAKRYGISIEELCSMNNITKSTKLIVGQKLRVKLN